MADAVNSKRLILVFGATGQQGGSVAKGLRDAGWQVRAFVRDANSANACALAALGCEIFAGNLADPKSLEAATDGVYGVFSVQPSSGQGEAHNVTDEQEISYGISVADAAQRAGIEHLVYSSANAASAHFTGIGHFDSKIRIERHLSSLSTPTTVIRPSAFMEILMLPGLGLDEGYIQFFMRPDQVMQFIAVEDIGHIVERIFANPSQFIGQTFEIAGDAITGTNLAAKLSQSTGHHFEYRRFPSTLLADNEFLARLTALVDDGRLAGNANLDELRDLVPALHTFDTWLSGPGKYLLTNAIQSKHSSIALR